MTNADITSLKRQIAQKRRQCAQLAFRYEYGHEAMPVAVGEKINAIESEIDVMEKALHSVYDVRGMLKSYQVRRTTVDFYQHNLRAQLTRPMIFHSQDRTVTMVHPTEKPLVYRIEFPFVCEWHDLRVTCHIDDLLETLEAMDIVDVIEG